MIMLFFVFCCLSAELPIGVEFPIDEYIKYVPEPYWQSKPACGFDGTDYLVAWLDLRNGGYSSIYCARVAEDGEVLDPAGIAVTPPRYGQGRPAIGFDGTKYLLVWHWEGNIYGAGVGQNGDVLDYGGKIVFSGTTDQYSPVLAYDDENYLMVWEDGSGSDINIYGSRIDTSGTALDPSGIAISTESEWQTQPAIAFADTTFLVTWVDERSAIVQEIYGARVTTQGTVLDPAGILIATSLPFDTIVHASPSVSFGGADWLCVYQKNDNNGNDPNVYGRRIAATGTIIDSFLISNASNTQSRPRITFDGTNYLAIWQDTRPGSNYKEIYGTRITPTGTVLEPSGIPISTMQWDQSYAELATGGTACLAVWQDHRLGDTNNDPPDIYGARVNFSGTVLDPNGICLSTASNQQYRPSCAFDGTNYLVVWEDFRNWEGALDRTQPDVYGARITPQGSNIDSLGILIAPQLSDPDYPLNPVVAFDGTNYLVVWEDWIGGNSDVLGRRVSTSGAVIGSEISICTTSTWQRMPDVVFGDANYLTVWMKNGYDVYGARVSSEGAVLDPEGFPIRQGPGYLYGTYSPSVAFDGTNYLVAWTEDVSGTGNDIRASRVDSNGTVLDLIPVCSESNTQAFPSLSFDGTNYLAAWHDNRGGSYGIYAARITPAGAVVDTNGILISGSGLHPEIVYNGTDFIIVWQTGDYGTGSDIRGAQVNSALVILDTFFISKSSGDQLYPSLAPGSGDEMLAVYSGWRESPYNSMRIWGSFYPEPGISETQFMNPNAKIPILQVYPSPFSYETRIFFSMEQRKNSKGKNASHSLCSSPTIRIYDATGRLVKSFARSDFCAFPSSVLWDGTDDAGQNVSAGVYFIHLESNQIKQVEKVIRLR
jgi:hypothetical protein